MTKQCLLAGFKVPALGLPTREYTCHADLECDVRTREERFQRQHQARMQAKYWKTAERKRVQRGVTRECYDQAWAQ